MDYKCLVCGTVFDDSVHEKCPKCGFIALHLVGDVDENSTQIRHMIEEYRKENIVNCQIFAATYNRGQDSFEKTLLDNSRRIHNRNSMRGRRKRKAD